LLVTGGIMQSILRKNAQHGVLDYVMLMSCLQQYKAPHRKITELLRSEQLIRIKKGLYVLGTELREEPINKELLANQIFGPSYVSQEFALQYYELIPERVEVVTSMTTKRNKRFNTPIGQFRYTYLNPKRFTVGVNWLTIRKDTHVLFASLEKALADTIFHYKDIKTVNDMAIHLIENLRIDEDNLKELNLERLHKIQEAYKQPRVSLLYRTLKRGL